MSGTELTSRRLVEFSLTSPKVDQGRANACRLLVMMLSTRTSSVDATSEWAPFSLLYPLTTTVPKSCLDAAT